jgi:hypothetical protein
MLSQGHVSHGICNLPISWLMFHDLHLHRKETHRPWDQAYQRQNPIPGTNQVPCALGATLTKALESYA